jgi:hypothetical protein
VVTLVAGGPALEHLCDTPVETFGAGLKCRREMACQYRRQLIDRSAENYNTAIVGFAAGRIARYDRAPQGG